MTSPAMHQTIHGPSSKQLSFSRFTPPLLTINSGDEVTFDNRHAGFGQIDQSTTDEDLIKLNIEGLHDIERILGPLYVDGPIFVRDAEPGDTLEVEILELQTGNWGWTMVLPGLGLLKEEIAGPHIKTFQLNNYYTVFKAGIKIPAAPFYGTMGVAPAGDQELHPLYPRNDIGGNFDCRRLGVGAKLFLPVNVSGALFSVGDAHFCQGDGEITGTALETTMKSRLRLTVIKGKPPLTSPQYEAQVDRLSSASIISEYKEHGVLATASTRNEAIQTAVRNLLDWLTTEKDLSKVEGYMLFSMVGNLRFVHELGLDIHTVSASIPLGLFES